MKLEDIVRNKGKSAEALSNINSPVREWLLGNILTDQEIDWSNSYMFLQDYAENNMVGADLPILKCRIFKKDDDGKKEKGIYMN